LLASSLNNLAFLLQDQGTYRQALGCFERSLSMKQGLNELFLATSSEAEALNWLASLPLTLDGYLSVARRFPDSSDAAYSHVRRGRGSRALLLEHRRQAVLLGGPAGRTLGKELADVRQALAGLLLAPPAARPTLAVQTRELNRRKEDLERQLAGQLPA